MLASSGQDLARCSDREVVQRRVRVLCASDLASLRVP
jgi:hypothetical protein